MEAQMQSTPIFVKVDEYKEVLETMQEIKAKVDEAKQALVKINELKHEEDEELQMWDNEFVEIERQLTNLESELFNPDTK